MKLPGIQSIFTKLLTAYGITFLVISFGFTAFRVLASSSRNIKLSDQNLQHYVQMLTEEIGTPPDLNRAGEIAADTSLNISIQGPDTEWTTGDESDENSGFNPEDHPVLRLIYSVLGDYSIQREEGDYTFTFTDFHADYRITVYSWLILTGSLICALAIHYGMVRHLLKPVRKMNAVALEFGVDHWKKRVHPRGNDEFATLGREMDAMADRIVQYIDSMHELLAAVSHELRSPLTRMKVALEFIDNSRVRDSLREEIDTLNHLTESLLEQKRLTTQPDILRLDEVHLQEWISSFVESYRRKGISLELQTEGEQRTVLLDRSRMELVLRNLVENSLRYAAGSPISINLDTRVPGRGFILQVQDHGPGMPESLIQRIGEPFLTGDPARSGSRNSGGFGLGLSIVEAVVRAHGAELSVRNADPQGLAVSLDFSKRKAAPRA